MLKKILAVLALSVLIVLGGCSSSPGTTSTTPPAGVKTIRETTISGGWIMKQLEVNLGSDIALVLKLAEGDKVDGFFYLEKGTDVGFQISGTSSIFESQPAAKSAAVTSDRFSFVATQAQGLAYTLTLSRSEKTVTTTVFLELIYPSDGSLFVPIGTK
jgi:hypothetical protein